MIVGMIVTCKTACDDFYCMGMYCFNDVSQMKVKL